MSKRHKHHHKANSHTAYQSWRKQPKEAFKLGKSLRPVWGGSFSTMQNQDWALLICCNGQSPLPAIYASPQALQILPKLELPAMCPYLRLDWPDLGVPEIRRDFWDSLVVGLQRLGRPGPIGVCCMGGTGRTGTALAIIAELSGAIPVGQCPVSFIRANYASDAIESKEQGKYITEMTGAVITTPIEKIYSSCDKELKSPGISSGYETTHNDLKCVHGIGMHLFCPACDKNGNSTTYYRDLTSAGI